MNTGILWINNPAAICQKLNPGEITSSENTAKKHRNIIDRILGVQYINLLILFSIYFILPLRQAQRKQKTAYYLIRRQIRFIK